MRRIFVPICVSLAEKIVQLWPFEDPCANVLKFICHKLKTNHATTFEIYNSIFQPRMKDVCFA
jgi:hypothetical protein